MPHRQSAQYRQQNPPRYLNPTYSRAPAAPRQLYQEEYQGEQQWEEQPIHGGGYSSGGGGGGTSSSSQQEKPTGLRHFSTKVCEKVKEKGLTNYNEVADELVADYFQNNIMKQIDVVKQEYDMKNIRRRVYDALNVLLAMNIITKNKKDIRWIGLPASAGQEITRLEEEKVRREASIRAKKDALQQMIMHIVSYKNLIARNRKNEHANGRPDPDTLLHLPFLIINTDRDTNVECSVSADKSEFLFSFDKRFEIHDDFEVLKKLNLDCGLNSGTSTDEQIKQAKSFLPNLHQKYVDDIIENQKRLEAEEQKKQMLILAAQQQLEADIHAEQMQAQLQHQQYYDEQQEHEQQMHNASGRFNRQLQEHLMSDGSEDRTAAAGILDDEMMEKPPPGAQIQRGSMYNFSSPQKRPIQAPPTATRRYYVQKSAAPQAARQMARPYPQQQQRMVGGGGGPVKYYVPQATGQRYIQRVRPQPPVVSHPQQRVVYTSGSGIPAQLAPGQRIVTQRVVAPGGPHPPGTIVRKVIRKIVVNNSKQSPAQQVIQKKMMEQQEIKQDQVAMTSAQAAAMIQHPPQDDFDYFQ
uniref:Transcription factor Dp-1 n=1 Tax=Caenorhabditis tropicalis TaxID=1561998 RepID=A0A1I7V168_9PELO